MGLRERIRNARGIVVVRAIMADARAKSAIVVAIMQSTDGGLLVHAAIERDGR